MLSPEFAAGALAVFIPWREVGGFGLALGMTPTLDGSARSTVAPMVFFGVRCLASTGQVTGTRHRLAVWNAPAIRARKSSPDRDRSLDIKIKENGALALRFDLDQQRRIFIW